MGMKTTPTMDVSEENHHAVQQVVEFLVRPLLVTGLELSVNVLGCHERKRRTTGRETIHRQTDRQTEQDKESDRERQRVTKETNTHRQRKTETKRAGCRQTDRDKQTDKQRERQ